MTFDTAALRHPKNDRPTSASRARPSPDRGDLTPSTRPHTRPENHPPPESTEVGQTRPMAQKAYQHSHAVKQWALDPVAAQRL